MYAAYPHRGGVTLYNPGEYSPPRSKCPKNITGVWFSVGIVVSYAVYGRYYSLQLT